MWICEKCKEENEDSFDSCWKCQTHSEIGSDKSKVQQEIVREEEEKKETIINEVRKNEGKQNIKWVLFIFIGISLVFGPKLYKMYLENEIRKNPEDYILERNVMTGQIEYNSQEYFDSIRRVQTNSMLKKLDEEFDSIRRVQKDSIIKKAIEETFPYPTFKGEFKDGE